MATAGTIGHSRPDHRSVWWAVVSPGTAVLLLLAGACAGLAGSIAGLASLFSYPALLIAGLSPVSANVTNTVALVFSSVGSVTGSRPELAGQRARLRQLVAVGMVCGALGGGILLLTSSSFELIVPAFIAFASVLILVRRRVVTTAASNAGHRSEPLVVVAVGLVCVYGGYFGAGAGVLMLALLLLTTGEGLPLCNGIKNVVLGAANGVAAIAFAIFGDVRWWYVIPLGLGCLIGGRLGPTVVRRTPAGPLRVAIAIAGMGLAVKLGIDTYT